MKSISELEIEENHRRICQALKSFVLNIHVWIFFIIANFLVFYLGTENDKSVTVSFIQSVVTLVILVSSSYFVHYASHNFRNIFTIGHHYHHETSNKFIGDGLQINLEFLATIMATFFINPLSAFHFFLIYTSIHNVNYGYFHVNSIHEKHHREIMTNIGPDICDVLFNTKYKIDSERNKQHEFPTYTQTLWNFTKVIMKSFNSKYIHYDETEHREQLEDISHIIPNIMVATFAVLLILLGYNNPTWKPIIIRFFKNISILSVTTYTLSSVYLYIMDKHKDKTFFM